MHCCVQGDCPCVGCFRLCTASTFAPIKPYGEVVAVRGSPSAGMEVAVHWKRSVAVAAEKCDVDILSEEILRQTFFLCLRTGH